MFRVLYTHHQESRSGCVLLPVVLCSGCSCDGFRRGGWRDVFTVTRMLPSDYKDVAVRLQGCCRQTTRMFPSDYKDVAVILQGCCRQTTRMLPSGNFLNTVNTSHHPPHLLFKDARSLKNKIY
jgi:hypothetical protein